MEGDYFSAWLPRFAHYLRMRNYSPRTIQTYEGEIRKFAHYVWLRRHSDPGRIAFYWKDFASARLDTDVEVEPLMINDFLAFITSQKEYRPATLHRIISTLSSFYHYCSIQKVVPRNPLEAVERPRVKDRDVIYMKHDQVLELIRSIEDPRDQLVFRTIYATGVRVSELCTINIEDIDFEEYMIRIRGKGGKIRIVFIDEETLLEIGQFIGEKKTGPLFVGQQGHHLTPRQVQRIFKDYAPPGITPHKLRHSHASELYRRSHNLRVVQENLGHSSIRTTEIYLHTDLDERKEVYKRYFPLSNSK